MNSKANAPKPQIVALSVTDELRDEVDAVAAERVWSRAQAMRYLIERGLEVHSAESASAA